MVVGPNIAGRVSEQTAKMGFRNGTLYRTIIISKNGAVSVATT
jgi:hypothetical protein